MELARTYNAHQPVGQVGRESHLELLNSFLRTRHKDHTPGVSATVTKAEIRLMSDRYATVEAELTQGSVDSRFTLSRLLEAAPDDYTPDVPADAVDLYLQNVMILSRIRDVTSGPAT